MFLRLHPGELNAFSGASLVALLWACAAALLLAGVCVLSGRPRALVWIDKQKRFSQPKCLGALAGPGFSGAVPGSFHRNNQALGSGKSVISPIG